VPSPRRNSNRASVNRAASDRVGGPSTSRGINFQLLYAISKALDLVLTAKTAPQRHCSLSLEPRLAGAVVTAWDVHSSPPDEVAEVKLDPTHDDVLAWLDRIREANHAGAFVLMCGRKHGDLLSDVEVLVRLANEARRDSAKFMTFVAAQDVSNANNICARLGSNHQALLERLHIVGHSMEALRADIEFRARWLAGSRAQDLSQFLFTKFSQGNEVRRSFAVDELITEIESIGITLYTPPEVALADERPEIAKALFLLQRCKVPLPISVMAKTINMPIEELERLVSPFEERRVIVRDSNRLRMTPLTTQITTSSHADLLARALLSLLDFVKAQRDSSDSRQQIQNIGAFSRACAVDRPEAVIDVFERVQSILKAMGDKHLVLEVADLCLACANRLENESAARTRALTLICGKSWVFQRTGRLDEAMALARKSLDLGKTIPWPRNTAYCMKCIGRLLRMQALACSDRVRRKTLLAESVQKLREAIQLFENSVEHGPTDPDTGDCYSLLGRTYLEAGDVQLADECVRKAFDILLSGNSKDYLDLKILAGDVESKRGNAESAEVHYSDVLSTTIPDDHERSEILARAYLQRGLARQQLRRPDAAESDFQKAHQISTNLDERVAAARAEWHLIRLTHSADAAIFEREPDIRTRVKAFQLYQSRVQAGSRALAHRSKPSDAQTAQLIKVAREEISHEPEW
jgi:tetratricopeptide (TPR) repeat protein